MAKRAHAYPQVDPGAAALVNVVLAPAAPAARVGEALALARRRNAAAVGIGDAGWVLREDLARASALGLDALRAAALVRPLPRVEARASEVAVRRWLAAGAPLVVVRDRRGPIGAVTALGGGPAGPGPSVGRRIERLLGAPAHGMLATVGRVAAARDARAFLVGGTVREALLGVAHSRRDLDIVVEGDGLAVARGLADELGRVGEVRLVEHPRFLTASVSAQDVGRIDVATARSERYDTPGALPRVMPSTITQDLVRRDFTINAMAVELGSGAFGLLDPFGGRRALAARRVSVLHPLAFVEDPTRIFRAARYAVRLGFRLDGWTARAQALALTLAPYRALSGARLLAELELILAERAPGLVLGRLGAAGVFRLLDGRYRFTRATATRIATLGEALAWARGHGLRPSALELALLAIVGEQPGDVALAALRRLALDGEPLGRLERALEAGGRLGGVREAARSSDRARLLRGRSDAELAWAWVLADEGGRAVLDWFAREGGHVRPALGGDDLVALGVERGPRISRLLGALRDARLDGMLPDRDSEVEFVRRWLTGEAAGPPEGAAARPSSAGRAVQEEG